MKQIHIPHIQSLTGLLAAEASEVLMAEGSSLCIDQVNWPESYPYSPKTTVRLGHSADTLYLRYDVTGSQLRAVAQADQDAVWCDSCVEFFCQPEGEKHYMNFETNCAVKMVASRRMGRDEDVVLCEAAEMQAISRYSSIGEQSFEEKDGEYSWHVCIAIPIAQITGKTQAVFPVRLRGNFYKCADSTKTPHFVSWNPILTATPDFHCPQYFGEIILD